MNCFRSALLGLGLLLAVSAAEAQEPKVQANIPFDFVVGNQVLPAGEYVVSPAGEMAVSIRSTAGDDTILTVVRGCAAAFPSEKSRLVFHSVGGRYFLSQVWASGYSRGRELPRSKAEALLAKSGAEAERYIAAKLIR
jgi:hypothetical protein